MSYKTLMFLGACVVGALWVIGLIGLAQVVLLKSRAEFPGLEVFGGVAMFAAMSSFVLGFIHMAVIAQRD